MSEKERRPNHEGGITQIKKGRKKGYWVGTISLPNGDRQYIYDRVQANVINEMNHLKADLAAGEMPADRRITLAVYLEQWLEAVYNTVGYNTRLSYRQRVTRILKYTNLGRKRLSNLTALEVQRGLAALALHYAPETVRQSRGLLTHSLNDAVRWGIIPHNVAALTDAPRVPKAEPATLSEEQVGVLKEGTKGDYYHVLWCLMVTTGLRLGEATGLRWRDVDLGKGRLGVQRTLYRIKGEGMQNNETKTAGSRREVRIAPWVLSLLKAHRAAMAELQLQKGREWNPGDLVFVTGRGTPVDPSNANKVWDRTLARLGLPEINPHALRHTAASLLLRRGVHPKKVQALLGHSSIRTTMDLYSHLMPGDIDQTADEMEKLFGDSPEDPSTPLTVVQTVVRKLPAG